LCFARVRILVFHVKRRILIEDILRIRAVEDVWTHERGSIEDILRMRAVEDVWTHERGSMIKLEKTAYEELRHFYSSPNIVGTTRTRRVRW
jgi:hypothetical protein